MYKQINGNDETRKFLENLGLVKGTKIVVVTEISGNLIINVRDTRVAVSRAMASRIVVTARVNIKEEKFMTLKDAKPGQTVRLKRSMAWEP